eukprot:TRINITY_DN3512_c0_g3_i3.p1 TRINITY_DN3512_c0_g3~~TRINITY_DN3512_c0_g3_i3.p1  ORF type:complete len:622 (+),score=180.70 TRINITY_DN3512_c0_g3_i3:50-1915(+)
MQSSSGTVFWFSLSPNANLVTWFCVCAKINVDVVTVDITNEANKRPQFLNLNPSGEIPVFKDSTTGAVLNESSSIVRYLALKHNSELLPFNNPQQLIKIDGAYTYIRGDLWQALGELVINTFIKPRFYYASVNTAQAAESMQKLNKHLKFLNDNYFKDSSRYVVGNSLTLADLALGTALFWALNVQESPLSLSAFPRISVWWNNMIAQPHFQKAHKSTTDFIQQLRPNFKATMAVGLGSLSGLGDLSMPQAKPGKAGEEVLYWFPLSNNSNLVYWFAIASKINVQLKRVHLPTGEHKKPEFLAINPSGQVPALQDGEIHLYESSAIIRYLAIKYNSSIYPITGSPADLIRVDSAYQHIRSNIWSTSSELIFNMFFIPNIMGKTADLQIIADLRTRVMSQLSFMNDSYFNEDARYVVGNFFSIADIALGTAVFWLSNFINSDSLGWSWPQYPKIESWWAKIQEADHFKRAHYDTLSTLAMVRNSAPASPTSPVQSQQQQFNAQPNQQQQFNPQPAQSNNNNNNNQQFNNQTQFNNQQQFNTQPAQVSTQVGLQAPQNNNNNNAQQQVGLAPPAQDKGKGRAEDSNPHQTAEDEIQAVVGKRIPIIVNEHSFDRDESSSNARP